VDRTGSGSCPMDGFGTISVDPLCSAAREIINW
jgi:hypothetical protein